jgi:methyl-accepting chemotaxis protein
MNISRRILLLIVISVSALVVAAGIGFSQLLAARGELHGVTMQVLPSTIALDGVAESFQSLRARTFQGFVSGRTADASAVEKELADEREELEGKLADYEKLASQDSEGMSLAKADHSALSAYFGKMDAALKSFRDGQAKAALDTIVEASTLAGAVTEALDKHREYIEDQSKKTSEEALASFQRAIAVTGVTTLLCVTLLVIYGMKTRSSIVKPLDGLHDAVLAVRTSLDLSKRAPVISLDEVGEATAAFNTLLETLQQSFRTTRDSVHELAEVAGHMASAAGTVSSSSAQQNDAVREMAARMHDMTASIRNVSERALEANAASRESGELAQQGSMVIGNTTADINAISAMAHDAAASLQKLAEHSARIDTVVGVIREVADQTNLLALNAAIEAARAGEQGRGFAVVADEVRKLAERTAQSTREIGDTITAMRQSAEHAATGMQRTVAQVEEGVARAGLANESIAKISAVSASAIGLVGQITTAVSEQNHTAESLSRQVTRIADMADGNTSAASDSSRAAAELNSLAARLRQVVGQYKV